MYSNLDESILNARADAKMREDNKRLLEALENLVSVSDERHPRYKEALAAINQAKKDV